MKHQCPLNNLPTNEFNELNRMNEMGKKKELYKSKDYR